MEQFETTEISELKFYNTLKRKQVFQKKYSIFQRQIDSQATKFKTIRPESKNVHVIHIGKYFKNEITSCLIVIIYSALTKTTG